MVFIKKWFTTMGKKQYRISENSLRDVVKSVINEAFGLNGSDLEDMGLNNPANDYTVNYTELAEKCSQVLQSLESFTTYIDGVEEDAENGVEKQDGVRSIASMRGFWSEEPDDEDLADWLKRVSENLYNLSSSLRETISQAEYMAQWEAKRKSYR